jgi:hypothetical protein
MLLLILNAQKILWLIKNTVGHVFVSKLKKEDGTLLDVDSIIFIS